MRKLIFMHLNNARTVGHRVTNIYICLNAEGRQTCKLPVFKHNDVWTLCLHTETILESSCASRMPGLPAQRTASSRKSPVTGIHIPYPPASPLRLRAYARASRHPHCTFHSKSYHRAFPTRRPSTPLHRNRRDGPSLRHGLAAPGSDGRGCCARSAIADTIASTPAAILPAQSLACRQYQKLVDDRHHSGRTALPVFPQMTDIIPSNGMRTAPPAQAGWCLMLAPRLSAGVVFQRTLTSGLFLLAGAGHA